MAWTDAAREAALQARKLHAATGEKYKLTASRKQPSKGGLWASRLVHVNYKTGPQTIRASKADFKSKEEALRYGLKFFGTVKK